MSGEPDTRRSGGKTMSWHGIAMVLLCAPGMLHPIFFCLFAFRARALYGGWPPVFHFYAEMQPWTALFEYWQGGLTIVACASGALTLLTAIPVLLGCRRFGLPVILRDLAILTAVSFLGIFLPLLLLPGGAIDWWYD